MLPWNKKKVVSMSDKLWVWNFWCNDSYLFIEKVWPRPISIKEFMMLWICFESIINFTTANTKLTLNICFGQNGWIRKHCNLQVTIYLNISNMVEGFSKFNYLHFLKSCKAHWTLRKEVNKNMVEVFSKHNYFVI